MRKFIAAMLLGVIGSASAQDFSGVEITSTDLGGGLYMLEGAGGNLGLSVGPDGAFLIDDQFAPLAGKIQAAVAELTDQPVRFLLNTHWHGDHTGGNAAFAQAGAVLVAHDNVHARLRSGSSNPQRSVPPAPVDALPHLTFSQSATLHLNGHAVHAFHVERAHTDGDVIVHFEEARVMHMGDVFFSNGYPFIDLASGGTITGYIDAQKAAYERADDATRIIPGHGALTDKAGLKESIDMLEAVRDRVVVLLMAGRSEDEVVAEIDLSDLSERWDGGFISGETMIRQVFRSLQTGR